MSEVARSSTARAERVPRGSVPLPCRHANSGWLASPAPPTGPIRRSPRAVPAADRKITSSEALLTTVPPSQAETWYLVPGGTPCPAAVRSGTCWVSTAVPPAPPANSRAGWPVGCAPEAPGKRLVP